MKTKQEIMDEAKENDHLGTKLAFYCTKCPWWTTDPEKATVKKGQAITCIECDTPLRFFALEDFFNLHNVKKLLEGYCENRVQEAD